MKNIEGFSIIEVLIAVIILAGGMLGLAGLQASGLKSSLSSHQQSQATTFAYDLADRIRANSSQIAIYLATSSGTGNETSSCLTIMGCNPIQMAGHDIFEWKKFVSTLPYAISSLSQQAGGGTTDSSDDIYTIVISLDGDRNGDIDSEDPIFKLSFTL